MKNMFNKKYLEKILKELKSEYKITKKDLLFINKNIDTFEENDKDCFVKAIRKNSLSLNDCLHYAACTILINKEKFNIEKYNVELIEAIDSKVNVILKNEELDDISHYYILKINFKRGE